MQHRKDTAETDWNQINTPITMSSQETDRVHSTCTGN